MATLTDRPKQRAPAPPPPPAKPPEPPQRPVSSDDPSPPPSPPGREDRRMNRFYPLHPLSALVLGAAAIVAIAGVLALSLAPSEPPPATGAAELVPGNALLYLHLSTDASRPAVRRALALSGRLPGPASVLGGL